VLDGYNATVMAFGQTGAGKTYTMTGSSTNYGQRGIIPRAISQIFREADERQDYSINIR
jgi:kinesin family protein 6/9